MRRLTFGICAAAALALIPAAVAFGGPTPDGLYRGKFTTGKDNRVQIQMHGPFRRHDASSATVLFTGVKVKCDGGNVGTFGFEGDTLVDSEGRFQRTFDGGGITFTRPFNVRRRTAEGSLRVSDCQSGSAASAPRDWNAALKR